MCLQAAITATCSRFTHDSELWLSEATRRPRKRSVLCQKDCAHLYYGRNPGMSSSTACRTCFHPQVPFEFVYEMFSVMREAARERGHVFQVLTKRPGRAVAWWKRYEQQFPAGWPPNVWIGTSVESQKYAPRLTVLARLPAPIRFVSAEPLLEQVDLRPWLDSGALQWVIVGGESGHHARPMDMDWVRAIRNDCDVVGVPFFFKQWGGRTAKSGGRLLDERTHDDIPATLSHLTIHTQAVSQKYPAEAAGE